MAREDSLLKQSLLDLAPRVDEAELWDSLQTRVAVARRERIRRLALVALATIIIAALALAAYEMIRWQAADQTPDTSHLLRLL